MQSKMLTKKGILEMFRQLVNKNVTVYFVRLKLFVNLKIGNNL